MKGAVRNSVFLILIVYIQTHCKIISYLENNYVDIVGISNWLFTVFLYCLYHSNLCFYCYWSTSDIV